MGGVERGGSHCKWCANDMTAYFKNNVVFFYKQKFLFSPLFNLLLTFLFLSTVLHPSPYGPFWGSPFPSLNKEEEIKRWNYG